MPEVNYIDREVFAKLRRLNIVPSDLSGDAEFLRRVTIDTIGALPTPEEVRDFLADKRPDKRARKIDELLAHPLHAALWATKFCDITGNNTDALENPQQRRPKLSQMWHDWFRKRVADNMPYDEIVRGVLSATSRDGHDAGGVRQAGRRRSRRTPTRASTTTYADRATLDLFWRRQQAGHRRAVGREDGGRVPGRPPRMRPVPQAPVRPLDAGRLPRLRQHLRAGQLRRLAGGARRLFDDGERRAQEGRRRGQEAKQFAPRPRSLRRRRRRQGRRGRCRNPDTNKPLPPKALGGPEITRRRPAKTRASRCSTGCARRTTRSSPAASSTASGATTSASASSIRWTTSRWPTRRPTPKLLDALAKDFVDSKYDIRHLERHDPELADLPADSTPNETNQLDRNNYSHSYVRPMMAEVVVDVLNDALGVNGELRHGRAGRTAGPSRSAPAGCRTATVAYAFRIFGRPPRTTACDCERAMEPALPQKLFLMADANLLQQARRRRTTGSSKLLASNKDDDEALDELFLATLIAACRPTRSGSVRRVSQGAKHGIGPAAVHRCAVGAD